MKKRYQIDKQRAVQQFRRLATEENPNIQMVLPLAEIVGLLQEGVGHLLREAGFVVLAALHNSATRPPPASRLRFGFSGSRLVHCLFGRTIYDDEGGVMCSPRANPPQVLNEGHVPLLDRKLRPFCGLIEIPAQRVKNHQSAGCSWLSFSGTRLSTPFEITTSMLASRRRLIAAKRDSAPTLRQSADALARRGREKLPAHRVMQFLKACARYGCLDS